MQAQGHRRLKQVKDKYSQTAKSETARRIFHASMGLLALALYLHGISIYGAIIRLLPILLAFGITDAIRIRHPDWHSWFMRYTPLGFVLRRYESKRMSGSFWFSTGALSVLIAAQIMGGSEIDRDRAALAIFLLAWCDPAAAFVGQNLGGKIFPKGNKKSIEGFFGALLVGCMTTWIFSRVLSTSGFHVSWTNIIIYGTVAAIAERIGTGMPDDNFVIPVLCYITICIVEK